MAFQKTLQIVVRDLNPEGNQKYHERCANLGAPLFHLLFRKMKQRSAEIGAPLVVFLIPLRIQISDHNLQSFLEGHDMTRDQIMWDQPQRTMMQIGSVEGIMVIDLLADFRQKEKMAPDQLYLAGDGHWTAAGHRLASDLVAHRLITSGVLPVSVVPPSTNRDRLRL